MYEDAFWEGFNETLEKFAQFIQQSGVGQTYSGRQHQGLGKRQKGIEKMKSLQKKQMKKYRK